MRGVARAWDLATGRAEPIGGTPPDNRVSDIVESADGLVVCAQDNSVYFVDAGAAPLQFGNKLSFENAPKQMSAAGSTVAVTSQSPRVRRSPQTHRSPQAQLACRPAVRTHARARSHTRTPPLAALGLGRTRCCSSRRSSCSPRSSSTSSPSPNPNPNLHPNPNPNPHPHPNQVAFARVQRLLPTLQAEAKGPLLAFAQSCQPVRP